LRSLKQLRLCKTQHFEFLLESISDIQSDIVESEIFEAEAQLVLQKLLKQAQGDWRDKSCYWKVGNSLEKIGKSFMTALKFIQTISKYTDRDSSPSHAEPGDMPS
jgi:hypothetical protein